MKQKVTILGGGESGRGAALLAKHKNFEVFVSDYGNISENLKTSFIENEIEFEEKQHSENRILESDIVIKSPGISQNTPIVKKIRAKGIPIVSEIEFASRYTNKKIVAITGSNGKTTTTSLIAHMLKKAGLKVGLGGNIGHSFAAMVISDDYDVYVLEISSFQLEDIETFRPYVSILLNITPDHLDRYNHQILEYAKTKLKITENQKETDFFIYNADDPLSVELLNRTQISAQVLGFSLKNTKQVAYATDKEIIINYNEIFKMNIEDLSLIGEHNVSNSLAGALNGNIFKLRKKIIQESLTDFDAIEHRLEPVLTIHGVQFINDSKATNVNAAYYALQSMKTPTVWIVGGKDKGNDYAELLPLVRKKVKAIVCLGIDNKKIKDTFGPFISQITETNNMKDAVNSAYSFSEKGDTVLLSPACASFDLFKSYEDRGNQFKQEVKKL